MAGAIGHYQGPASACRLTAHTGPAVVKFLWIHEFCWTQTLVPSIREHARRLVNVSCILPMLSDPLSALRSTDF
jgi:hypothetical protein